MEGLAGRVAIVTGAGRGIGRAHAMLLASHGMAVVVNDLGGAPGGGGRDDEAALSVAAEIQAAGGQAVASTEDVASFVGARELVETAVGAFGTLHLVVNNAAISRDLDLLDTAEADFDAVIAVNLKGTFNVNRHAAELWRRETEAGQLVARAIVNTSSGAGLHGTAGGTSYAAAKAGVAAMTIVAARELAPYGVRVNAIAPIARTRLTLSSPGVAELLAAPAFDPEHAATLTAVLAAEGCPFTGQVFSVCGPTVGLYAGWSIAEEITADDPWTVDGLRSALAALPTSVPTRSQGEAFARLAGFDA